MMTVIVLVEDSIDDRDMITDNLRKMCVLNPIVSFSAGQDALDYIEHGDALPALVLLDLKLDGAMDGLFVLKRIRETSRTEFLPVVILTGSKYQDDEVRSWQMGTSNFLRKPLVQARFVDVMRELGLGFVLGRVE